ncbi:hypothetical protein Hdeb2414_s0020g00561211 [Helianthus debilis subsp. tardiflorus]
MPDDFLDQITKEISKHYSHNQPLEVSSLELTSQENGKQVT